jgi:signal peptidase I
MSNDQQTGAEEAMDNPAEPQGTLPEPNTPSEAIAAEPNVTPEAIAVAEEVAASESAVPEPAEPIAPMRETRRDLFGVQSLLTVIIFSVFVITFVVQAFQIPSGSMENTLLVGDFLLVDKIHFAGAEDPGGMLPYRNIHRGDIIVFYFPVDPSQFLVKRVIGMPGDHIRLRTKTVYINDVPLKENYVIHKQWIPDVYRDNFPAQMTYSRGIDQRWRTQLPHYLQGDQVVVPMNSYFVLGDNRDDSEDSRYWGFVPRANVIGRPLVIYLSVKESEPGRSSDKLQHSGQVAHWLQLARWDRMFRLVH